MEAPLVPETLLKKRRDLEELRLRREEGVQGVKKPKRVIGEKLQRVKRPEEFVRQNRIKKGSEQRAKRLQRQKRKLRGASRPSATTIGFIIRTHDARHAHTHIKSLLRQFRLNKKYDGTFIQLNEATLEALKPIDPYVVYGHLTNAAVLELLRKRATVTINGENVPLSDNNMVEEHLQDCDILCIEDMANEIVKMGEHFARVTSFLAPFHLAAPVGTFERNVLRNHEAVESKGGFIGDEMSELIHKML